MSFKDLITKHKTAVFEHIVSKWVKHAVYYTIDRKYRDTVNLSYWLRNQILQPSEDVQALAEKVPDGDDPDKQMEIILKYFEMKKGALTYKRDIDKWGQSEKWETIENMSQTLTGDCESGAALMYGIAREKGVDANQLRLFAGFVVNPYSKKREGHAYLAYLPLSDPFHWVILDWCYLPNTRSIPRREKFYIKKVGGSEHNKIYVQTKWAGGRFKYVTHPVYENVWWGFNETDSIKEF